MKEIYKKIKGYENNYEVSNFGMVRSIDRTLFFNKKNGQETSRSYNGRLLKFGYDKFEYPSVVLSKNGSTKQFRVHQLVAMAFLNHTPDKLKIVVDHIDKDPKNNHVDNLRLITHRDNVSRRSNKTSKYTGVCWHSKHLKWIAYIQINKKNYHLGYFDNEEKANQAYQNKLNEKETTNMQML